MKQKFLGSPDLLSRSPGGKTPIQNGRWVFILILIPALLQISCTPTSEYKMTLDEKVDSLIPLDLSQVPISDHRVKANLKILVAGDSGRGTTAQFNVADAMAQVCNSLGGCDFALFTGDNIYPSGVSSTKDVLFELFFEEPYSVLGTIDIWTILGNHDWKGNAQAEIDYTLYSPRWRLPYMQYNIPDLPEWVRISTFDINEMTEGANHLKEHLCNYDGWKISVNHQPMYSNGSHGNNSNVISMVKPTVLTCGIDLLISGHDHDLELLEIDGAFLQLVSGAAAEGISPRNPSTAGTEQLLKGESLGFNILEITANQLKISFYDTTGTLTGSHSVVKTP